jgi:sulfonate transport system ATP-binding protein
MLVWLSNVGKVYLSSQGDRRILSNISLTIQKGEAIALMGANGIGKSTLARIIAGVDDDFDGKIERAGNQSSQARMIFQDFRASLLPWLSIERNIEFPLMLKGLPSNERHEMIRAIMARAPDRLDLSTPISKLSGGQAQLVCILRALVVSPNLLICDEPFSAVDYPARIKLRALLASMCHTSKIALIFVTHSIEDAMFLADRILILGGRPGSIVHEVPVGQSTSRDENWLDNSDNIQLRRMLREQLGKLGPD